MSIKIKHLYNNCNSLYIIDEENNLYVSGNNKNGRLGLDSLETFIKKITKISIPELENNVEKINFDPRKNEEEYELITLTTLDGKIYIAGNTGDNIYRSWTLKDEVFVEKGSKYTVNNDKNIQYHSLEIPVSENNTYLFSIIPENDQYYLDLRVNSVTDIFNLIISCTDKEKDFVFNEYTVTTKKGYELIIEKREDGTKDVYLKIIPNYNQYNTTVLKEILNFSFKNLFSKIIYDENIADVIHISEYKYEIKPEEASFSADEKGIISDSLVPGDTFNSVYINAELDKKSSVPFTEKTYKDPLWIYTIFDKLGLEHNKWYKFEGSILRNGIELGVSSVKISDVIDNTSEGAKIGVVQFMLNEYERIEEWNLKNYNLKAITFYPIMIKNSDKEEVEYKIHDSCSDFENSMIQDRDDEEGIYEVSIVYAIKGILVGKNLNLEDFSQIYVTE